MPRLFIGNLPNASSDMDLQQWVESNGFVVESVQIIRDRFTGMSRGFGFVTVQEQGSIQSAITTLNGKRMNGRILTVNEAVPLSASLAQSRSLQKKSA